MGFGDLEVWVWGSVILALDTGECAWMAPGWYGKHGSAFCVFGLHLGFYCSFWKVLKWSEWLFLAWASAFRFSFPIWPEITYLPENWVNNTTAPRLSFRDTSCVSHLDCGQFCCIPTHLRHAVVYLPLLDHSAQSPTFHLYMSATSTSLELPSELEHQPSSGPSRDLTLSAGKWGVGNVDDDHIIPRPAPTASLTRIWTSLQDHADTVQAVTPGGSGASLRPEDRREGFTCEVPKGDELDGWSRRRVLSKGAAPPPIMTRDNSRDNPPALSAINTAGFDNFKSPSSQRRTSTARSSASAVGPGISRHNTGQSSIGSIAKGLMRHVPDIRMFVSDEPKSQKAEEHGEQPSHPNKSGRKLSFKLPTALKKQDSDERAPKRVHLDAPGLEIVKPSHVEGGLKARRAEAMKLTLPLEMPNLPPRRRMSIAQNANTHDLAPRRPRSPKTPGIRDTASSWEPMSELPPFILQGPSPSPHLESNSGGRGLLPGSDPIISSVPPNYHEMPIRIRKYINRPRQRRESSYTSVRSIASLGAFASDDIQTRPINAPNEPLSLPQEELKQIYKLSRRWRWSSPFSSSEAHSGDSPSHGHDAVNAIERRCSFSNLFHAKRKSASHDTQPAVSPFTATTETNNAKTVSWHRNQTPNHKYDTALALANMPVPLSFIPPGLKRVPTPPMLDERGELKDTLSDFVFEMNHLPRPKPSPGLPGRVWDSDVVLMPMESDLKPEDSDSDESPQGPFTPHPDAEKATSSFVNKESWIAPLPTPSSIQSPKLPGITTSPFQVPQSPPPSSDYAEWFRVPMDADSNLNIRAVKEIKEEEERAKYEWLTPEHLPSSPLCPLHAKYRGPSKGMCVFHRETKGGKRVSRSGSQGLQTDGGSPAWEGDEKQWERGFLAHRRRDDMSSP
jgi:hypothetical protein